MGAIPPPPLGDGESLIFQNRKIRRVVGKQWLLFPFSAAMVKVVSGGVNFSCSPCDYEQLPHFGK